MSGLDQEEKSILAAFERGKLKSVVTSKAALRRYRKYARATLTKQRPVNIRLSTQDLRDFQARAMEEGIPYQTFMASVLHKFLTGRLIEKRSSLTVRSRRRVRKRAA
jgi:predicted DNA binding CopG/RHH family protein